MKYTEEQRVMVVEKGLCIRKKSVAERKKLDKEFPVKVEVKADFYIIESKLNYE